MSTAQMRIDQVGLEATPGTPGVARTDGLDDGGKVTLTSLGLGTRHEFVLLWVPPEDTTAEASLVVTGNPRIWEFDPTPGAHGEYLIGLVVDRGTPNEVWEYRVFGIRLPVTGLLIPAFNSTADPEASLVRDGAEELALSANNAVDFTDPVLNLFGYTGWWRALRELILVVEALTPPGGTGLNSVVNVGGEERVFRNISPAGVANLRTLKGTGLITVAEDGDTIAVGIGAVGDVVGPASATDNALARFDSTTGKLIQNSVGTLTDAGLLSARSASFVHANPDDDYVLELGSADADYRTYVGLVSPLEVITGSPGDLYIRANGTASRVYQHRGSSTGTGGWVELGIGTGDVVGPAGATDNAIARYDGTTGKLIQNSLVTIDDGGGLIATSLFSNTGIGAQGITLHPAAAADSTIMAIWDRTDGSSNPGYVRWHIGDRNPEGNVSSTVGAIYIRTNGTSSKIYQLRSASGFVNTPWVEISAGSSGDVVGPGSATNEAVALFSGTTGKLIKNSLVTVSTAGNLQTSGQLAGSDLLASHALNDTQELLALVQTGTNPGSIAVYVGNRNPEGNVTGGPGDLYVRDNGTSSRLYQLRSASSANTPWVEIGAGSSGDVVGPASATDNALARYDGTTGKLIQNSVGTLTDAGLLSARVASFVHTNPDDSYVLELGSDDADYRTYVGLVDPLEVITGSPGDLYVRANGTASNLYQYRGSSSGTSGWVQVGGSGSGDVVGPSSATNDAITRYDGTTGKLVQNSLATISDAGNLQTSGQVAGSDLLASHALGDTQELLALVQTGSNGGSVAMYVGNRNPEGNVTASPGDLYIRDNGTSSRLYQLRSSGSANTPWTEIGAGSSSGDVVGPSSATDNAIARFDSTTGKLIQNSVVTVSDAGLISTASEVQAAKLQASNAVGDTQPLLTLAQTGSNGGVSIVRVGNRDPNSNVTGDPGDIYVRSNGTSSKIYQLRSSGPANGVWYDLTSATGDVVGPASATDTAIAIYDGATGKLLKNSGGRIGSGGQYIGGKVTLDQGTDDNTALLELTNSGTNPGATRVYIGNRSPESNVTAEPGAIYVRANGTSSKIYQKRSAGTGSTSWVELGAATGDVAGPSSATDNAVTRYDGTTGKLVQNSLVTIDDGGGLIAEGLTSNGGVGCKGLTLHPDPGADSTIMAIWDRSDGSTNPGYVRWHIGDRNPEGNVSSTVGAIYIRTNGTSSKIYQLRSASGFVNTPWVELASGSSGDVVGPGSATDNAIARFDSTTGKLIQNSSATVSDTGVGTFVGVVASQSTDDTTPTFTGTNTGTNAGGFRLLTGSRSPEGNVTANSGDIYIRDNGSSSNIYQLQSSSDSVNTPWVKMGGVTLATVSASGTNNDYAPANFSRASTLVFTLTGDTIITGFDPTNVVNTRKYIVNIDSTDTLTIPDNDSGSTPGMKVRGVGGLATVLKPLEACCIEYDSVNSVWRTISIARAVWVEGPTSATDNAFARFDGTTGKLIQNSSATLADTGVGTFVGVVASQSTNDATATLTLTNTGTNAGSARVFVGNRTPEGNVSANAGDLYIRDNGTSSKLYQLRSSSDSVNTPWVEIGTGAGTGDVVGPASATDNAIARFDTTTGKLIQNSSATVSDAGVGTFTGLVASQATDDTTTVLTLANTGTNAASGIVLVGDRSPEGNVTAAPGTLYLRVNAASSRMYQLRSASSANTPWYEFGPTGSVTPSDVAAASSLGSSMTSARADHVHGHGAQTDPTQHALATGSAHGFLSSTLFTKLNDNAVTGPASATDNAFARFDATTGKLIQNSAATLDDNGVGTFVGVIASQGTNDATATLTATNTGTNPGSARLFVGNRSPEGNVTGNAGDLYVRDGGTSSRLYQLRSATDSVNTPWVELGTGNGDVTGPGSATDNAFARFDLTTGKILQNSAATLDDAGIGTFTGLVASHASGDTTSIATLANTGSNAGTVRIFAGSRTPEGNVTGNAGDIYVRDNGTSSKIYQLRSSSDSVNTPWVEVTGTLGLETFSIPARGLTPRFTNGAVSGLVELTTNKIMIESLDFDPATIQYAQFTAHMPKRWDGGTVVMIPGWSHPATTTNFGAVFGFQTQLLADDAAQDAAFGTAVTVTDTGGTTDDIYIGGTSAAITPSGSGTVLRGQVYRDATNGSDTLAVVARLQWVTMLYTINAPNDT